jgi:hypothetical protein
MNPKLMQEQLSAVTNLTLGLTELLCVVAQTQTGIIEELQALRPNGDGVIRLLSKIEQTQAALLSLRDDANRVSQQMRDAGLM